MPVKSLSADCLFHFTSNIEYLEAILLDKFYPRYVLEDFSDIFNYDYKRGIPMVCFCDIPLSQTYEHTSIYGQYAIGLRKDWGKRNKLCPIIYSPKNSFSSENLVKLMRISQDFKFPGIIELIDNQLNFIKPYEGKLQGKKEKIRFYDEREWRFVPDISFSDREFRYKISSEVYQDESKRQIENKKLKTYRFSLSFKPKDIKYIIVSSENEIIRMINTLSKLNISASSKDELKLLTTRIISLEQVKSDF